MLWGIIGLISIVIKFVLRRFIVRNWNVRYVIVIVVVVIRMGVIGVKRVFFFWVVVV